MIRITGGRLRGRRVAVPDGVRPTTERARQALFDILGPSVVGTRVLDAAAGSGAFGIEAISRGAREVVFVESSAAAVWTLRQTLERLALEEVATVVPSPVQLFATGGLGAPVDCFDLIFHDPPYRPAPDQDLPALMERLVSGGSLVHERGDDANPWPTGPAARDVRAYGTTRFWFYGR